MRFRITYSGELKAGGKKPRTEEKNAIRRYISPQLAELRIRHPVFRAFGLKYRPPAELAELLNPPPNVGYAFPELGPPPRPYYFPADKLVEVKSGDAQVDLHLSAYLSVNNRKYVPIVRNSLALTCSLNILFLRKTGDGALIAEGGDLDNRIKTLFDGLRVPKPGEVSPPATPEEADQEVMCLLEDDSLITDFSVTTDRLLTHPGVKRKPSASGDRRHCESGLFDVSQSRFLKRVKRNSGNTERRAGVAAALLSRPTPGQHRQRTWQGRSPCAPRPHNGLVAGSSPAGRTRIYHFVRNAR
jgi:hypothetical protein